MSRLADLINRMPPDKVEAVRLSELGRWYGGGTPSKARRDFWEDGTIPWISPKDMGQSVLETTEDRITAAAVAGSATKLVPANSVAVVVRSSILEHTLPVAFVPFESSLNQDMKAVALKDNVLPRYFVHVLRARAERILQATRKIGGSVASIEVPKFMALQIPVPPVEVQEEIVRTLDVFAELEGDLEAALNAELEARQFQYAHYRDSLMVFPHTVRRAPIGDLGTIFGGLSGKAKPDFSDGNARFVSYVNVLNNIAVDVTADDFVRIEPGERQRALQRGDVLFTGSSETPNEVAMSSVVTAEVREPLYLNSFTIGYRLNDPAVFDPEFTKHLFRSGQMRKQLVRTASGVTRFNVSKARLAKIVVPIPARDVQSRIASILDRFDALGTGLSAALPVELNARRNQYEYYRDRMLTFKELAT